jgi:hypothetical protein
MTLQLLELLEDKLFHRRKTLFTGLLIKRNIGVTFLGNGHFLVQAGLGVRQLVSTMVDRSSIQMACQKSKHPLSDHSSGFYNRLLHPSSNHSHKSQAR